MITEWSTPQWELTSAQALAHRQKPRVSNTPQAHRIARHLDVMVQELEDQRKLLEAATQLHRGMAGGTCRQQSAPMFGRRSVASARLEACFSTLGLVCEQSQPSHAVGMQLSSINHTLIIGITLMPHAVCCLHYK